MTRGAAPEPAAIARSCERFGLEPGRFVLYSGNLDAYQELADLAQAARRLAPLPVVVATHAETGAAPAPLRLLRLASAEEGRALSFAAAVAVLPRRIPGGFPIKLLNYMEAGRAIVAHASVAEALEHERSGWLLAARSDAARARRRDRRARARSGARGASRTRRARGARDAFRLAAARPTHARAV